MEAGMKFLIQSTKTRRFVLKPGTVKKTILDGSEGTLAVVMQSGASAKLAELAAGDGKVRSQFVLWDASAGKAQVVPADYAAVKREIDRAKTVVRYVCYAVNSYGKRIRIIEFCRPLEQYRFAEIDSEPGAVVELPGWIGREVTDDAEMEIYAIAVALHLRPAAKQSLP
jgi:CYTH domain-containing protein